MRKILYGVLALLVLSGAYLAWAIIYTFTDGFPRFPLFSTRPTEAPDRLTGADEESPFQDPESISPQVTQTPTPEPSPSQEPPRGDYSLIDEVTRVNSVGDVNPEEYKREHDRFESRFLENQDAIERWLKEESENTEVVLELIRESGDLETKVMIAQLLMKLSSEERIEAIESLSKSNSFEDQKISIELFSRDGSEDGVLRLQVMALDSERNFEIRMYSHQALFRKEQLEEDRRSFLQQARQREKNARVIRMIESFQEKLESKSGD